MVLCDMSRGMGVGWQHLAIHILVIMGNGSPDSVTTGHGLTICG